MGNIKNFAEKHDGHYKEENIKNVYSLIGRMISQPKRANFVIDGSKISLNIDEVGGAIPTAEPFRITLHLNEFHGNSIEIYPATFLDIIFHKIFISTTNLIISCCQTGFFTINLDKYF